MVCSSKSSHVHVCCRYNVPVCSHISDQCNYKMEAMRGLGVDRHLFGLYIVAKGMNLDPMPKMFSDKVYMYIYIIGRHLYDLVIVPHWLISCLQ